MKELVLGLMLISLIPVAFAQEYPELQVKVQVVADNLTIPWSIDWLPDGTILVTERNGNLRIIQHGILLEEPILTLGVGGVEGGMLGVTVDPKYSENNLLSELAGKDHFLVSDLTPSFEKASKLFFGEHVTLEKYKLWE